MLGSLEAVSVSCVPAVVPLIKWTTSATEKSFRKSETKDYKHPSQRNNGSLGQYKYIPALPKNHLSIKFNQL